MVKRRDGDKTYEFTMAADLHALAASYNVTDSERASITTTNASTVKRTEFHSVINDANNR